MSVPETYRSTVIGSIKHSNRQEQKAGRQLSHKRGEIKILMSLTLGKYCTGTDGVVELRYLSRFPARQPASRPPLEAGRPAPRPQPPTAGAAAAWRPWA